MDDNSSADTCCCPPEVRTVAEAQEITCERLFRYAYEWAGDQPSYSLAIFMVFVGIGRDSQAYFIPLVVRDFCARVGVIGRGIKPQQKDVCSACMLSAAGRNAAVELCAENFPEVSMKTLISESSARRTQRIPLGSGEAFSIKDRYWLALLESGVPDANDEPWDLLVQHQEEGDPTI